MLNDENIKPCSYCEKTTSFERHNESLPHEGEVCYRCEAWVCDDCIDWKLMKKLGTTTIICKRCGLILPVNK
jgi:3-deoxy-D-manno-octulosonate 8-phosphate phosphatase KdsC-like HAD superfamily phosphatase